ncbi:hypothetical protein FRC09_019201 [Ceratobasidium sp. 395]|nr:hypothetical protein FRC09_019201 [Ceratobasidium sp. 395]
MPIDSNVMGLMQGAIGSSTPHTHGQSLLVKNVSETAGVAAPNLVPDRTDEVKQRAVVAEQLIQPRSPEANRSRSLTSFANTALAASVITPMNAASFATVPVHQNWVVPLKVLKRNLSPDSGGKKKKSRSGAGSGR